MEDDSEIQKETIPEDVGPSCGDVPEEDSSPLSVDGVSSQKTGVSRSERRRSFLIRAGVYLLAVAVFIAGGILIAKKTFYSDPPSPEKFEGFEGKWRKEKLLYFDDSAQAYRWEFELETDKDGGGKMKMTGISPDGKVTELYFDVYPSQGSFTLKMYKYTADLIEHDSFAEYKTVMSLRDGKLILGSEKDKVPELYLPVEFDRVY